jgi:hypothetical protein
MYNHHQLCLCDKRKRAGLSAGEKKKTCAYKAQYPGSNKQNIANNFPPFYGVNPKVGGVLEKVSVKKKREKKTKLVKM